MNTATANIRVKKAPHWKKTAPLKSFSFTLNEEQFTALRLDSMKMRGFSHDFFRDVETKIITVHGKNEKRVLEDIANLFPNIAVEVKRVFVPFYKG